MVACPALGRQGNVMKIVLKSLTALGVILAATSFAAAQEYGPKGPQHDGNGVANESFIVQTGYGNIGLAYQAHIDGAKGLNRAATIQDGDRHDGNFSATAQVIANPFSHDGNSGPNTFSKPNGGSEGQGSQAQNNSLVLQDGSDNGAVVLQGAIGGGVNNQLTWQNGDHNFAFTAQISNSQISNSSFTGQFGSHNVAATFQH